MAFTPVMKAIGDWPTSSVGPYGQPFRPALWNTERVADDPRPFVFDVAAVPGMTNEEMLAGVPDAEALFELLGRDLVTQRVGAGMGYFSPDALYSWTAGEDGAEWIEIHSGLGGIYTDRPGT